MTDTAALGAWAPRFEDWKAFAMPLLAKGEAKAAFSKYPWFTTEGDPFARLEKPAKQTHFALITTGGYSVEGVHEPFTGLPDFSDDPPLVHTIPLDVDRSKLGIKHVGYDHRFAKEDINVNLPLDRLSELAAAGEIGSVAHDTEVLMGLIPNVAPLVRETIPQLVEKLRSDSVEAALLVPS
jgi:D-proline reductase (dithiol) PrdB